MGKKIFFLAGENSGDINGALVIKRLKEIDPALQISGIGGPKMEAAGLKPICSSDDLAVIGFIEVAKSIFKLIKIEHRIKHWFKHEKPDMVVLIDYPGFNKRIAAIAKSMGIHVVYYICPQVWAWNSGRVKSFTEVINEAVVVFPFEVDFWSKAGCKTNYFGHPLLTIAKPDVSKEDYLKSIEVTGSPVVSLMPGSRKQEVGYILPELIKTAEEIKKQMPHAQFILPLASSVSDELVHETVDWGDLPVKIVRGNTYNAIGAADLCIVASGTATLETAIIGTPLIVVYQANWFTRQITKLIVEAENIGMPNVIAGKRIVPECIREDFNAEHMAEIAVDILTNEKRRDQIKKDLAEVRAKLGKPGAASRVADYLYKTLGEVSSK